LVASGLDVEAAAVEADGFELELEFTEFDMTADDGREILPKAFAKLMSERCEEELTVADVTG